MNPMTGEPEDTDVGFPGPEHHVAERSWPMKAAMAPLALLAIVGGYVAIPGVDRRGLEIPRADLRGLADRAGRAHHRRRVARPRDRRRDLHHRHRARLVDLHPPAGHDGAHCVERFPRAHRFLAHKWYFDELYDAAFVRPARGDRAASAAG